MREILVRADDLGFSEAINYGMAKAIREGIIKTVGIIVNMESSQHGYDLIKDLDLCLGLHTNICDGRPLLDPKDVPSLCEANGEFRNLWDYRKALSEGREVVNFDEAVKEIEAQYLRFVEMTRQKPHYFETHAVTSPNFEKALRYIAQKYDLDYLEMSMDGPVHFRNSLLYTSMESIDPDYQPFEVLKKLALRDDLKENERVQMVLHPGYLDEHIFSVTRITIQRTREISMSIDPATKKWLKDNDVRIITYDDLK